TMLITTLLMAGLTGFGLWKANDISRSLTDADELYASEEKDLAGSKSLVSAAERKKAHELFISGNKKNVETFGITDTSEIYDTDRSAGVKNSISALLRKGSYTLSEPFFAYDPFGTNSLSMYIYFETSDECYIRYTVSVDDKTIPDFTRTMRNSSGSVSETIHEGTIMGLVPGMENYIELTSYDARNKKLNSAVFSVTMPVESFGNPVKLTTSDGDDLSLTNGLFTLFPSDRNFILIYDNSGVIRGEMPLLSSSGVNMQQIGDELYFVCDKDKLAAIDNIGMITKVITADGYTELGEFDYDEAGHFYMIADAQSGGAGGSTKKAVKRTANAGNSGPVHDRIISLDPEKGTVSEIFDPGTMPGAAGRILKAAGDPVFSSIQADGKLNSLLAASAGTSSIIQIDDLGTDYTNISMILGDAGSWNGNKALKKKIFARKSSKKGKAAKEEKKRAKILGLGTSNAGQAFEAISAPASIVYDDGNSCMSKIANTDNMQRTEKGTRNISLYALGHDKGRTYFVRYKADTKKKVYYEESKVKLPESSAAGNVQAVEDSLISSGGKLGDFTESSSEGKLLRSYKTGFPVDRVYKYDYKALWFG
ncbi:MAG: aryl-sulfate sulfotransferase, partial [Lachnospiraceae bacterium]|nr:aryl-sulfate sulfotransferase [Lachnospiraceae bacterium]